MQISRIEDFLRRRERIIVAALAAAAAVRIFLFSAGFPIFNNVDEPAHLDIVRSYARGEIPDRCAGPYDRGTRELMATYSSPEFLKTLEDYPDWKFPPPLWRGPDSTARIQKVYEFTATFVNKEPCSPPTYYLLAGLWYDLGKALGLTGASSVYWVRFLNVPNIVALVYLSCLWVRRLYPGDVSMRIAAPLLVAFFAQDTFFSINSDVLSPLLFGLALYLSLTLDLEERGLGSYVVAGLIVAAAVLTKISNFVLVPIAAAIVISRVLRASRAFRTAQAGDLEGGEMRGKARRAGGRIERQGNVGRASLASPGSQASEPNQAGHSKRARSPGREMTMAFAFALAAALPVLLWLARNQVRMGDALGTAEKTDALGWTPLPLGQRWSNPIFGPAGFADFTISLIQTFWRGEFIWHGKVLTLTVMDGIYVASSLVFVSVSVAGLILGRGSMERRRRLAVAAGAVTMVLFILFLVWASIRYDYGQCFYPSRDRPYLRSGRLMLGMLIPFVALYLDGLGILLSRFRSALLPIAAAAIALTITICEIVLSRPVFSSPYNWFHLH